LTRRGPATGGSRSHESESSMGKASDLHSHRAFRPDHAAAFGRKHQRMGRL